MPVRRLARLLPVIPGTLACLGIALVATFIARQYGGPQLLYALLIGLAFHFFLKRHGLAPGINFCARTVLRIGVALLGARISLGQVAQLGLDGAVMLALAVPLTIVFGVVLARLLGCSREQGLLSGGAVAICGASAALAVASVLPQTRENERWTLLTVVGVTVLSTVAMVIYPFALSALGLAPMQIGIVLGGAIHDVAQVVAAGMMLGPQVADSATVVKLFRVMLLMPVVLGLAVLYRHHAAVKTPETEVPLVPGFLLGFVVLMLLSSAGSISAEQAQAAGELSRWLLVIAIAAVGMKTSFEDLLKLGWQPVALLLAESAFIVMFVLTGTLVLGLGLA